jgi:hypothetical protein
MNVRDIIENSKKQNIWNVGNRTLYDFYMGYWIKFFENYYNYLEY